MAITCGSGICASNTQRLLGDNVSYCKAFLLSFKSSPLNYSSGDNTCEVLTQPVKKYFKSPYLKDLSWIAYPVKDVVSTAKYLYHSAFYSDQAYDKNSNLDHSETEWIKAINKINNHGNIYVSESEVKLNHGKYFVLKLSQRICDYSDSVDGSLPIYAFFKDRKMKHPTKIFNYPGGKLVYYHGILSALRVSGNLISTFNGSGEQYSKQYSIVGFADSKERTITAYMPGESCYVQITKL